MLCQSESETTKKKHHLRPGIRIARTSNSQANSNAPTGEYFRSQNTELITSNTILFNRFTNIEASSRIVKKYSLIPPHFQAPQSIYKEIDT